MKLVLASTSAYRKILLSKLAIPFDCIAPDIDETPFNGESAQSLVKRLAIAKAHAIGKNLDQGYVIGSDQVACLNGQIIGKPSDHTHAKKQLMAQSSKRLTFYTGLCLFDVAKQRTLSVVEPFEVEFRSITPAQIERYLKLEQPYDCAGSFKSEGLGIYLFSALHGRDPNSLIGLPLIALNELFISLGIDLLDHIPDNA